MIPPVAHFIWLGRSFPWVYSLALCAARNRGGFSKVVLHHTDRLDQEDLAKARDEIHGIELRRLHPKAIFTPLEKLGQELFSLYEQLHAPAARSNVLRIAILAQEGGVYLDTDVITLSSFRPLLQAGIFCGTEHIALPSQGHRNPLRWPLLLLRLALRDGLRQLPLGYRWFRRFEKLFPMVPNNAVLGAEAGHPFLLRLLQGMVALPKHRQLRRFALGTHLLEKFVQRHPTPDLVLYPPSVFYPLPPEISEHWFRLREDSHLSTVLSNQTVAVHWYASVRTRKLRPIIDAEYIRFHAERQFFSQLALPLVRTQEEAA